MTVFKVFGLSRSIATGNMLTARVGRRIAAPPKWGPKPYELSNSARRAIATSPPPSQEEKGRSTLIQDWWFLIPAALFASAAWNLFRARANEKVRNYRESRLEMEALKGNEIHNLCSTESLDSMEFRKVVCKGVYDEKGSILVKKYLKMKSGNCIKGFNLPTPLMPIPHDPESIHSPILVNRGWVPLSWGNNAVQSNSSSSEGEVVQFVGVVSKGERPNKLWRWNNPAQSEWFTVDVASLASACGLPEMTLHVVEIDMSRKMNTRKPAPFASLRHQVKGIYLSQLEHERYSSLGFFNGCAAMAIGLKKFGKL